MTRLLFGSRTKQQIQFHKLFPFKMSSQTEARTKEIMVTYPGNNFGCALVGKSVCAQAVFRMRSKLYCKY